MPYGIGIGKKLKFTGNTNNWGYVFDGQNGEFVFFNVSVYLVFRLSMVILTCCVITEIHFIPGLKQP